MAKKTQSRTINSIRNVVTGFGGQMLATILRFVVRTVFIKTLGKSYLGINGLFSDILTMLSLTELGFDTAINFKLYEPLAKGDDKRVRVLMKFYKKAYRAVGSVILILGICLIPTLPFIIKDYDSLAVLGINASLIFMLHILRTASSYLFFAYRSAVVKADQKKYILDIAGFFVTIATNVTKIIVLVFYKDFMAYTATVIVFNILQNIVNAVIAQKMYPQFFKHEDDDLSKEEIMDMMKDCGALFVYKVNNVVVKATDNTVISAFIGLATVGMYSNYLLFYTTIRSLFDKVYTAIKASMGNLFATESIDKKYAFFKIMNFMAIVLFGTAGVGVAVCADELITVWVGGDYVIPQPFAILIGTEILFHGLKINLGQIRNVSGVFRQMWFRPVLGVIINLGVSITLVQIYGIYGVIIGTITADILTNFMVDPSVIHKYSFNNYRPVSDYYKTNLKYLAILTAVCTADFFICRTFLAGYGWLSVIVHVIIVGCSVPLCFILLYRNANECQYLIRTIRRVLNLFVKRIKRI
ncbi:MAG: hypothetical protein K6F23_15695 [Solobacterium sp.]|nr:hypothetical protein [Solobacterium sp.]